MKRILFYGDSNTWGYRPDQENARYPDGMNWVDQLAQLLPEKEYRLFNEGLCGRTTGYEIPEEPGRNGLIYFPIALSTIDPIDLVVIMLGTNDRRLRVTPQESAKCLERYIHITRAPALWFGKKTPEILLIAPAPVCRQALDTKYSYLWDERAIKDSCELGKHYKALAEQYGCAFLDCAGLCETGEDGVHLSADGHRLLAGAAAEKIRTIFAGVE